MKVDCHVHGYPEEAWENPEVFAKKMNEPYWGKLVTAPTKDGKPLQSFVSMKQMFSDMAEAEIDKVCLLGWYWEHQTTCSWHNNWLSEMAKKYTDKIISFACVQPRDGLSALDDLKKAIDNGCKGIGEVFPAAQQFSIKDPIWLKIVEYCTDRKLPINLHVPEAIGHHYMGKIDSSLTDYHWLAKNYPETIFIFAHWGGGMLFYELNPRISKDLKNVYYDTAASPLIYNKKIFKIAIDILGSKKIIFGSDYPLRTHPKNQSTAQFKLFIEEISSLNIEKNDENNLYYFNIMKIIQLNE